jgi:hypothetical protein
MSTDTATAVPITALHHLAAAHLDDLQARREAAERSRRALAAQRAANEARDSVAQAVAFLVTNLPQTLDQVLTEADWTGYPSLPDVTTLTAAAPLGQGVWAVFHDDTFAAQLLLLVPCPCGHYIERDCRRDEDLALALVDVARWQADPATCTRACTNGIDPEWADDGS